MKKLLVLAGTLRFGCLVCAQTNAPLAPLDWFALPAATLKANDSATALRDDDTSQTATSVTRTEAMPGAVDVRLSALSGRTEPPETTAFPKRDREDDSSATVRRSATYDSAQTLGEEFSIRMAEADFDARLHERFVRGGYLNRPDGPSDNLLVRATDAIFTPEVVRFRKVEVSCSILTAIKRKNPLCLLSPIFLNVSW